MSKSPKPGSQRKVELGPNMQPIINVPTLGHLLSDIGGAQRNRMFIRYWQENLSSQQ